MPENGADIIHDLEFTEPVNEKPVRTKSSTGFSDWLRTRMDASDLFDAFESREKHFSGIQHEAFAWGLIGKAMWVTFALMLVTGIGMMGAYIPTISSAFSSAEYLQSEYPLGWWLRGVHKWGSDLFLMLAVLRILKMMYRRSYKANGELGWLGSVAILIIFWFGALSGYLLIWNQRGFEGANSLYMNPENALAFEKMYPLGGMGLRGWLSDVILGGMSMTQPRLQFIYAIHIICGLAILFITLWWRTHARPRTPAYMNFSLKIPPALFWSVAGSLSLAALLLPPPLGSPLDTLLHPHPAIADWYYMDLYQWMETLGPYPGMAIMACVFIIALLLPWLDRAPSGRPRAGVTGLVVGWLITSTIVTAKSFGWEISDSAMIFGVIFTWFVIFAFVLAIERVLPNRKMESDSGEVTEE